MTTFLVTDFAVAEYNHKHMTCAGGGGGITPNKIAEHLIKLDTFKGFSFVVNERYLFLIDVPYDKKKINGADYGTDYPYEEVYKNAYLISKKDTKSQLEDSDDDDNCGCKVCSATVEFEDKPKCMYYKDCKRFADYKTLDGERYGKKSESWGKLDNDNNHKYYWNLCGYCYNAEQGDPTDTEECGCESDEDYSVTESGCDNVNC